MRTILQTIDDSYLKIDETDSYLQKRNYVVHETDITKGPRSFVSSWHKEESKKKSVANNSPRSYSRSMKEKILKDAINKKMFSVTDISKELNIPFGTIISWKFNGLTFSKILKNSKSLGGE